MRVQLDAYKQYTYHDVVQKPIAPAYKEILEKTKSVSLRHQALVVDEPIDAVRAELDQ